MIAEQRNKAMAQANPEIESQLNELARLCCQSINGEESELENSGEALLRALVMCGFTRSGLNMRNEVESRAKSRCMEIALYRGSELESLTSRLDEKLQDILRWDSTQPDQNPPRSGVRIPRFNES
jgi:hypothetical protein